MWSSLVLFYALATPILVVWIVFVTIPETMHTRYRHDLWAIRDAIVDDVIAGELTLSPQAQRLLRSLYVGIHNAHRFTLRDGLIALVTVRHVVSPDTVDDVVLGGDGLPLKERERLAGYLTQYREASVWHMVNGSPSGWLGWVVFAVMEVVRRFAKVQKPSNYVEDAANLEIAESAVAARSADDDCPALMRFTAVALP